MNGYRTLAWSLLLATAGVAETFDWLTLVPRHHAGLVLLVVALVTAWLRVVTTTPVFTHPGRTGGPETGGPAKPDGR